MAGQVDRVGDHGGGRVRHGRCPRQHRDGVGDAEGEAAAAPAAGGDAAHRHGGGDRARAEQARPVGPVDQADAEALPGARCRAMSPPLLTNARSRAAAASMAARISSATAPATAAIGVMNRTSAKGSDGRMHASGDRALRQRPARSRPGRAASASSPQSSASSPSKRARRRAIGGGDRRRLPEGCDHQVDRPLLQVQPPAVGQHAGDRRLHRPTRASGARPAARTARDCRAGAAG